MFETPTSYCHSLEFEVFHALSTQATTRCHVVHCCAGPSQEKDKLLHTFCFGVSGCFWKKLKKISGLALLIL